MTHPFRCFLLAAAAVLALAAAPARAQEVADLGDTPHTYIRILQSKLNPPSQTLKAGEAVGWLNYSNRIARVSFPKEVAKKMVCKQEGSFRLSGERLQSGDIQASQFATLCVLSQGEYEYQVELFTGAGAGTTLAPSQTLHGKIVVQ